MNNSTIVIVGGSLALAALYFLYKPAYIQPGAYLPVPPTLPATQNPRDANAFCKQVVGTTATAVATFYGGAAGGAAASKTGASAGAGVGVCTAVAKVQSTQNQFTNYVANVLPSAISTPFKDIVDNAIQTSNPFYDVEHPVDAVKSIGGATKAAAASVVSTIGGWF